MKKLTYLLIILAVAGIAVTFTSCKEDEIVDLDAPQITAPSSTQVKVEKSIQLTFSYTAAAGFASSLVTASGGTATITTDGTPDATSGDIVVTFTAGNTAGAGSVALTVVDNEGDSEEAVAVLSADNSGVIKCVSIRNGGANIGEGNEINGLTLGGVGSGTTFENIEVIANQDDGVEWFGGTVDVTNVLVWNVGDDAIDTDQAWAGSLSNFVLWLVLKLTMDWKSVGVLPGAWADNCGERIL